MTNNTVEQPTDAAPEAVVEPAMVTMELPTIGISIVLGVN